MPSRLPPRAPRAGFTLVELLVASVLLGFGVVALAATAGHYVRAVARAESIAHATRLARAALERARGRPCAAGAGTAEPARAAVPLPRGVIVAGSGTLILETAFPCPR